MQLYGILGQPSYMYGSLTQEVKNTEYRTADAQADLSLDVLHLHDATQFFTNEYFCYRWILKGFD